MSSNWLRSTLSRFHRSANLAVDEACTENSETDLSGSAGSRLFKSVNAEKAITPLAAIQGKLQIRLLVAPAEYGNLSLKGPPALTPTQGGLYTDH